MVHSSEWILFSVCLPFDISKQPIGTLHAEQNSLSVAQVNIYKDVKILGILIDSLIDTSSPLTIINEDVHK